MKNTHPRGAGTIPRGCGTKENDAGLCYDKCKAGYYGVGPVCWSEVPKDGAVSWKGCGMGAAKDSGTCSAVITNQVISVAEVAMTVATLGADGAGVEAVNEATRAGAESAKASRMATKSATKLEKFTEGYKTLRKTQAEAKKELEAVKGCLAGISNEVSASEQMTDLEKALINPGLQVTGAVASCVGSIMQMNSVGKTAAPGTSVTRQALTMAKVQALKKTADLQLTLINKMAAQTPDQTLTDKWTAEDYARSAAEIAALADPTGVSSTIAAYTYPKCSAIFTKK